MMATNYVRSLALSSPDDSVLALDGNGVTPEENLNKLSTTDSTVKSADKVQEIVDQTKTKVAEKTPATKASEEAAKRKEIKDVLKKHPNIEEYSDDVEGAIDEWDYFKDEEYGQCMSVNGDVKELGFFENLQDKVTSLYKEYGEKYINPQAQDSLDAAKTKRLLKNGSAEEVTSFYSKSNNKKTIEKITDREFAATTSRGSWKTTLAAVKIVGKNVIRNRKKYGAKNLLANYKKDPLAMFDNKELTGLTGALTEMDPEWGGYVSEGITRYKGANFNSLSDDAAKLLGVDKSKYFPKVIKIAKKKKFDRKVNDRIKEAKKKVSPGGSGYSGSIYS